MKKPLLFSLFGAVLIAGTGLAFPGHVRSAWNWAEYTLNPAHHAREFVHKESEEEEEEEALPADGRQSRTDGPGEAMEQEVRMTRDPQTGRVPTERLYEAMEYYAKQAMGAAGGNSNARRAGLSLSAISWTERGANNIGGRTRAILFDKADTSGKTVFAGSVGGGLWKCTDITATNPGWSPVNDYFADLAITAIAQDTANPSVMYFGTGEGFMNGDAIKGGGIWKSTNSGATWTRLSSTTNDNFAYIQKMVVAPNGDVYAATRSDVLPNWGGLMKSINGGTSWMRVIGSGTFAAPVNCQVTDVEIAANGDVYAATSVSDSGRIFRSSKAANGVNTGNINTWTNITPAGAYHRIEIAVAPSDSNQVYALCQGYSSSDVTGIFSSSNKGGTWTSRTVPTIIDQGANSVFTRGQAWYDLTCAVDPANSQTVYIGGVDMLRSTNAGATFTQITTWSLANATGFTSAQNTHADIHTLVFRPGYSSCAIFGCDGGLEYSANLGNVLPSWTAKNTGYNVTQYYSVAASPTNGNYFLAGAQDNGTQKFTAPGVNSVTTATGGDGGNCWIDQTNGSNQITAYVRNNYYVSTNGGTSFTALAGGSNTGLFINAGDLDNVNDILYTGGNGDQLVRWSNVFGATATRTNLVVSMGGAQATAIKVSPNNPATVYVGDGYGEIYRVTNANTATPTVANIATALGSSGWVASIDVWKKSTGTDDSIAVAISDYGVNSVYITGNGTTATPTWTSIDDHSTLQDIPVRCVLFDNNDPKSLYLGTEVGVLATAAVNGSSTVWQSISNGSLPMVRTDQLDYNAAGQLVAATHGRGLFSTTNMAALPIKLTAFTAQKQSAGTVGLHWEIAKADAAAEYVIERMYSGEQDFTPVATIAADGASLAYNTTDMPEWTRGDLFYRLRCNASDGTFTYSQVEKIGGNKGGQSTFIAGIYPTVTGDALTIAAGNMGAALMRIAVRNAAGQVVQQQTGAYASTVLHLGTLAAGAYFVSVADGSGTQGYTARVVKQ